MPSTEDDLNNIYSSRRKLILSDMDQDPNTKIKSLLFVNLIYTDVCMGLFLDLCKLADDVKAHIELSYNNILNQKEESEHAWQEADNKISSMPIEIIRDTDKLFNDIVHVFQIKTRFYSYEYLELLMEYYLASAQLAEQNLVKILKDHREEEIKQSLQAFVEFLIGLTPVGPILDAYQTVLEIINRRKTSLKQADEYLDKLDEYFFYAYQYCVVTQLLVNQFDFVTKSKSSEHVELEDRLSIKAANDEVTARYEAILNSFTQEDPESETRYTE
jgi:hypothetical protein